MPVLVLRSVDDSANLRVMRAVLEALRARDYGRLRVGPFDDGLAAEIGVFVEGPKSALARWSGCGPTSTGAWPGPSSRP